MQQREMNQSQWYETVYRNIKKLFFFIVVGGLLVFTVITVKAAFYELYWNRESMRWESGGKLFAWGAMFVFLILGVLLFYGKKIQNISQRKRVAVRCILIVFILVVQAFFLFGMGKITLTTDSFKVVDMASFMVNHAEGKINNIAEDVVSKGYFGRYTNNHFVIIILYYFFRILKFFGCTQFIVAARILNVFLMDIGMVFAYFSARKIGGNDKADIVLLLTAMSPTTYVWLFWSYTNTFSIPFCMGLLLLYLYGKDRTRVWERMFYGTAVGGVGVFGFYLRPTTIIPIIAIILMELFHGRTLNKKVGKLFCSWFVSVLVVVLIGASVITVVKKKHLVDPSCSAGFPITHWIMMGLSEEGGFNMEDLMFTNQFATKEEKSKANEREIKNRIQEKGINGLYWLMEKKLYRVYGDGTDQYIQQKYFQEFPTKGYSYIYGERNDWFMLYCRMFRLTILMLTIIYVIKLMRSGYNTDYVYALIIFGSMLFFIIWEANRKYNISFEYVLLTLAGSAVFTLCEPGGGFWKKKPRVLLEKKQSVKFGFGMLLVYGIGICFTLIATNISKGDFTNKIDIYKENLIDVHASNRTLKEVAWKNQVVEQSFDVAKPFNSVVLWVKRKNVGTDTQYRMTIFREDGEIVAKTIFKNKNRRGRDYRYSFPEVKLKNKKKERFVLRIEKERGTEDFLAFRYFTGLSEQKYEGGFLSINGKKIDGSLSMQICRKTEESYVTNREYGLFSGIILAMEFGMLFCVCWEMYKDKKKRKVLEKEQEAKT